MKGIMDRRIGVVARFHSNMLDVEDENNHKRYSCTLRGKFKMQKIRPIVGDIVEFVCFDDSKGRIENILPRKNELKRPAIANIDQVILVGTVKHPDFSYLTYDKFLVLAEKEEIETVFVFNKTDLVSDEDMKRIRPYIEFLEDNYTVLYTSAKSGEGIEDLKRVLKGRISTMAGMSGVGKSTLLNAIDPQLKLKEGILSTQLERGKHTTTYSELLSIESGGLIADTPGFAFLSVSDIKAGDLKFYFPDFIENSAECYYKNCLHLDEPDCGVISGVEEGSILESRYNNYISMMSEIDTDYCKYLSEIKKNLDI